MPDASRGRFFRSDRYAMAVLRSPHGEFFQTWNCFGKGITAYDPPVMYDIGSDKSERYPLDVTTAAYSALLKEVLAAVAAHNTTLKTVGSGVSGQQPTQLGTGVKTNQPWGCGAPPDPEQPSGLKLGQCVGGPGGGGWQIMNHTGGGGPGFEHFPGFDLSTASVDACRAKCCASDYCVSITMGPSAAADVSKGSHNCWLNPARCGGPVREPCKAPFPQEATLMAFVKRNSTAAAATPHQLPGNATKCVFNYPNRDPQ